MIQTHDFPGDEEETQGTCKEECKPSFSNRERDRVCEQANPRACVIPKPLNSSQYLSVKILF